VDALATPFVQGRLRNEKLTVTVRTECAHCKTPMVITIDSDRNIMAKDSDSKPMVFVPDVDLLNLKEESIINAF
jgi:hypothetical protein